MLKDFVKLIFTAKALTDVLKEKIESKAGELAFQVKNFANKTQDDNNEGTCGRKPLQEKAKVELLQLISEITHKAQINELHLKGFIKDKLTELTNNALLDSMELNDIRAEIASLKAEIEDMKTQMNLQRR